MGQVSPSATPVTRAGQVGGRVGMPCEKCEGAGTCIPTLSAKNAFPDPINDVAFHEAIDREACIVGQISLDKARELALKHAALRVHKGGSHGPTHLANAIRDTVLRKHWVGNVAIEETLRDLAMSRIASALGKLDDGRKLYDFDYGTSLFQFVFGSVKLDLLGLLAERWREPSLEEAQQRFFFREDRGGDHPEGPDAVEPAAPEATREINQPLADKIWKGLIAIEPMHRRLEKRLLMRIQQALETKKLSKEKLSKKQTACLDRAVAMTSRALDGETGHAVMLYGNGGTEGSILLATLVRQSVSRNLYEYSNGKELTKHLPKWLVQCLEILAADLAETELRKISELINAILKSRAARKEALARLGQLRAEEEEGFPLALWNGPAHILTKGRVKNCPRPDSGYGIADCDKFFGCVPPDSPVFARFALAGRVPAAPVID